MNLDAIPFGSYTHDLFVHSSDAELVTAATAFVELGLEAGGRVLVHSTPGQVALLRAALGGHPRLDYAFDHDLYMSPMTTLFGYERSLAQRDESGDLWVVGTVPFGPDETAHPAWTRYESLVNEALGRYAFHAMCVYDRRTLPASTIDAALATHPSVSDGAVRVDSPSYLAPGKFLTDPRARTPQPPAAEPVTTQVLHTDSDLAAARSLVAHVGCADTALDMEVVDGFAVGVHEVLDNALRHGRPPVELTLWADALGLSCLVADHGAGAVDPLAGYRYPELGEPAGLWVARQFCEELVIRDSRAGAQVFMRTG